MALAIFDLDNTLIAGDSDHAWGQYLVDQGIVDGVHFKEMNDRFYLDYQQGKLDILNYLSFALQPLTQHPLEDLYQWRVDFVERYIRPLMLPRATRLLEEHRSKGDFLLIITATNRFVTQPIADALKVDDLIATEPEFDGQAYSGNVSGTPSYQEGKVVRLQEWLLDHDYNLSESYFYSDSHNDLPLLRLIGNPVAVDADDTLSAVAQKESWPQVSLR